MFNLTVREAKQRLSQYNLMLTRANSASTLWRVFNRDGSEYITDDLEDAIINGPKTIGRI